MNKTALIAAPNSVRSNIPTNLGGLMSAYTLVSTPGRLVLLHAVLLPTAQCRQCMSPRDIMSSTLPAKGICYFLSTPLTLNV
jgi:hypothetical protein